MGRLIVIVLIVVLVVWLLKRALAGPRKRGDGPQKPPAEGPAGPGEQGQLVDCAHCGVNLPKAEARSAGGRHYCSEEHWRAGPRDG
jgi:uncharacterized protein